MKEKIYIVAILLIFIFISLFLPVTNFKRDHAQVSNPSDVVIDGNEVNLIGYESGSCDQNVKIVTDSLKWITAIFFLILLIVALFLKNNIKKYFYIVMALFIVSLLLKYSLYGLAVYLYCF